MEEKYNIRQMASTDLKTENYKQDGQKFLEDNIFLFKQTHDSQHFSQLSSSESDISSSNSIKAKKQKQPIIKINGQGVKESSSQLKNNFSNNDQNKDEDKVCDEQYSVQETTYIIKIHLAPVKGPSFENCSRIQSFQLNIQYQCNALEFIRKVQSQKIFKVNEKPKFMQLKKRVTSQQQKKKKQTKIFDFQNKKNSRATISSLSQNNKPESERNNSIENENGQKKRASISALPSLDTKPKRSLQRRSQLSRVGQQMIVNDSVENLKHPLTHRRSLISYSQHQKIIKQSPYWSQGKNHDLKGKQISPIPEYTHRNKEQKQNLRPNNEKMVGLGSKVKRLSFTRRAQKGQPPRIKQTKNQQKQKGQKDIKKETKTQITKIKRRNVNRLQIQSIAHNSSISVHQAA